MFFCQQEADTYIVCYLGQRHTHPWIDYTMVPWTPGDSSRRRTPPLYRSSSPRSGRDWACIHSQLEHQEKESYFLFCHIRKRNQFLNHVCYLSKKKIAKYTSRYVTGILKKVHQKKLLLYATNNLIRSLIRRSRNKLPSLFPTWKLRINSWCSFCYWFNNHVLCTNIQVYTLLREHQQAKYMYMWVSFAINSFNFIKLTYVLMFGFHRVVLWSRPRQLPQYTGIGSRSVRPHKLPHSCRGYSNTRFHLLK